LTLNEPDESRKLPEVYVTEACSGLLQPGERLDKIVTALGAKISTRLVKIHDT
jgi:hypothetical protein